MYVYPLSVGLWAANCFHYGIDKGQGLETVVMLIGSNKKTGRLQDKLTPSREK